MARPKRDAWANSWWGQVRHEQKGKSVTYKTAPEERIRQIHNELAKAKAELLAMYEAVRMALGEPSEHPLTDIVAEHIGNIRKIIKTTEGI